MKNIKTKDQWVTAKVEWLKHFKILIDFGLVDEILAPQIDEFYSPLEPEKAVEIVASMDYSTKALRRLAYQYRDPFFRNHILTLVDADLNYAGQQYFAKESPYD